MPIAPPHPCSVPRCPHMAPCPEHARAKDQARGSAHQRGYDHRWSRYSKQWLARFPWCGMRLDGRLHAEHSRCVQQGLRVKAQCTDHIVAIRDGGWRLDPTNHQSLCTRCNVAKAKQRDVRER